MEPLSWSTLEFEPKDRHPDWVWTAGLVFAIAATICFFYGNIFFGIFLIVAGFFIIVTAIRPPKTLIITIDEKALIVNNELFDYAKMQRFWIDETGKPDKLLLLVRGSLSPVVSLPLEGVTAEQVRKHMKAKEVTEEFIRESTGVKIAERLGL